jgi:hypothetical protein
LRRQPFDAPYLLTIRADAAGYAAANVLDSSIAPTF